MSTTNDDRLIQQDRIIALFNGGIEGVAIQMRNGQLVEFIVPNKPWSAASGASSSLRVQAAMEAISTQGLHDTSARLKMPSDITLGVVPFIMADMSGFGCRYQTPQAMIGDHMDTPHLGGVICHRLMVGRQIIDEDHRILIRSHKCCDRRTFCTLIGDQGIVHAMLCQGRDPAIAMGHRDI